MIPTWIFFVCVAVAWWALKQPGRMLPVMLVSCGFLASAALEAVLLGGAPITPALFFVPFVWWAAIKWQGASSITSGLQLRQPGGWLLIYTGWLVFSAVFMPRFFAGEMLVYSTSRTSQQGGSIEQVWLAPNSTNLTQGVYVVAGLAMFLGVRALASSPNAGRWLLRALYAATLINALMILLNLAQSMTGQELGMSWIRNARYAVVSQSIGGWSRLQGAFAEPSAMAAFTTVPFAILLALWLRGVEKAKTGALAFANGMMLVATLSSTAFVSMVAVVIIVASAVFWTNLNLQKRAVKFGGVTVALLTCVAGTCLVLLASPAWLDRLSDIVYAMVFEKAESSSGQERLAWVIGTWNNFIDSYGIGSGTGSARGSSFPIVILGNTGVPGLVLMVIFVGLCLFAKPGRLGQQTPGEGATPQPLALTDHLLFAFRMGLVARLITLSLTGTMIDPGALFYVVAGVVAGLLCAPATTADPSAEIARTARAHREPMAWGRGYRPSKSGLL